MSIDVRTLYEDDSWGWSDYQPMLDAFGEIVVECSDNDYQGDTRVLYRDGNRFGYLVFGWGSCSGCDALQACNSLDSVQELADSLCDGIKWFDSATECLAWFEQHDWKGDYSYDQTFVNQAKEYLANNLPDFEVASDAEFLSMMTGIRGIYPSLQITRKE